MAGFAVDGGELVVRLGVWERLGAFRGDVRVPLRAVRVVRVSTDPWSELRGVRAPGTGFPGVVSLCTRRGAGVKDFAAVYGRRPAVVVEAEGADFDRLVVSCADLDRARAWAAQLTEAAAGAR
ncbi:hypothetical protein [Kitasatospora sp. NPDC101183]|uniref:hypothetical protein n=1 Tax=Kitasatospora sp. NPDC101183 TaxID=3364100 RepID=UPI003811D606